MATNLPSREKNDFVLTAGTLLLQIILSLFGVAVLMALLWEPHFEGRNANATLFEIYFQDPFLAYVSIGSLPFFIGLFQGFKMLGYARQHTLFSPAGIKTLHIIRSCALLTAGAIVGAGIFIAIISPETNDDVTGAVMLGLITTCTSLVIALIAAVGEKVLRSRL